MYTVTLYVLSSAMWDVVLVILALVVVVYVAKWLLSFLPVVGG